MNEVENCLRMIPDVHITAKLFEYDSEQMKPNYSEGKTLKNLEELYCVFRAKKTNRDGSLRVDLKKSSKVKDYSWWILVGNVETNKVYSLKKTFFKSSLRREFQFSRLPADAKVDVFLVSDSFIGIDQMVTIDLNNYRTEHSHRHRGEVAEK
jgi:hypothetical protein